MTDFHAIAERYLAAWNHGDDASRASLLEQGWAAQAQYTDPLMTARNRDEVAAMISAARSQFPGHVFSLRGDVDGHANFVRFSWTLAPEHGASIAGGSDVIRLDEAGDIVEVIGFLDEVGA